MLLEGGQGPPVVLLHGGIQAGRLLGRLMLVDAAGLGRDAPPGRVDVDGAVSR